MACLSYEEYQERRKKLAVTIQSMKKQQLHEALELFDSMKEMSYQDKINYTLKITEESIHTFGDKIAVACSFGKDSTLMLYFARQVGGTQLSDFGEQKP